MKFIHTLLALLMIQVSFAQFQYTEGGNNFDGNYRAARVVGIGTSHPYVDPILILNEFDDGSVNFYIENAGYWQQDTGIKLKLYFDNSNTIYSAIDLSLSADGKSIFISTVDNPLGDDNELSKYELISMMKNHSKISVRITDRFGQNDLQFPIVNNSEIINKVFPDLNELVITERENRILRLSKIANAYKVRDSLIDFLRSQKVINKDIESIRDGLNINMALEEYSKIFSHPRYVKGIQIVPSGDINNFNGELNFYTIFEDGTETKKYSTIQVAEDSPIYSRLTEIKKEQIEWAKNVEEIFKKFKIPRLIRFVRDEIIDETSGLSRYKMEDIKELKCTIDIPIMGRVFAIYLTTVLKDGEQIEKRLIVSDLDISRKDLKSAGLKTKIEF